MTIKELMTTSLRIEIDKGWHEDAEAKRDFPTFIALAHSELSEALEAYRDTGDVDLRWEEHVVHDTETGKIDDYKPCGVGSEIADLFIRCAAYCENLGIDLEMELNEKLEFNRRRPHRHGGKKV